MLRSESPSIFVSRRGSERGEPHYTVVWVGGEHDIATKVILSATVDRAARLDDAPLLMDLSAVTFMDASTVGAIVGSRNRLRARGQSLEVRAPSAPALRVLELCRLGHLVRPEPLRSTGVAASLGTWVDVPPIQPSGAERDAARLPARPAESQRAGVLATADVHVEEAATAVEEDRGGP